MRVLRLCSALTGAALMAASASAQKPGLPPGVYFLWTPPGPSTTTPDHPDLPNYDWVREQAGGNAEVHEHQYPDLNLGLMGEMFHRPLPGPRWLAISPGVRFADHVDGASSPVLHLGATDRVTVGHPADLWFSTIGVTPDDSMEVEVRLYATDRDTSEAVLTLTSQLPAPKGGWPRQTRVALGRIPAGHYLARIFFTSEVYGLRAVATEKLVAR